MKVLMIIGSETDNSFFRRIYQILSEECLKRNFEIISYFLNGTQVEKCTECFRCSCVHPRSCAIQDIGFDIVQNAAVSDLIIVVSPVKLGYCPADIEKILKRIRRTVSISTNTPGRDGNPDLVALGVMQTEDTLSELTFRAHISREALQMKSSYHKCEILTGNEDSEKIMEIFRFFSDDEAIAV